MQQTTPLNSNSCPSNNGTPPLNLSQTPNSSPSSTTVKNRLDATEPSFMTIKTSLIPEALTTSSDTGPDSTDNILLTDSLLTWSAESIMMEPILISEEEPSTKSRPSSLTSPPLNSITSNLASTSSSSETWTKDWKLFSLEEVLSIINGLNSWITTTEEWTQHEQYSKMTLPQISLKDLFTYLLSTQQNTNMDSLEADMTTGLRSDPLELNYVDGRLDKSSFTGSPSSMNSLPKENTTLRPGDTSIDGVHGSNPKLENQQSSMPEQQVQETLGLDDINWIEIQPHDSD